MINYDYLQIRKEIWDWNSWLSCEVLLKFITDFIFLRQGKGCYIYKYAICLQKFCNKTMPFTKSKIQSNLSSLRARKEQDVDLGFSCFPRIYLILFSASSIGKVSGSRLLHSRPDKLLKLKCAAAQSSSETNNYTMYWIQPIKMHLL